MGATERGIALSLSVCLLGQPGGEIDHVALHWRVRMMVGGGCNFIFKFKGRQRSDKCGNDKQKSNPKPGDSNAENPKQHAS